MAHHHPPATGDLTPITARTAAPTAANTAGSRFLFVGNALCLDFVNTELADRGRPMDTLDHFDDVVAWLRDARVLDDAGAQVATARWGAAGVDAPAGARAFAGAVALRAALRTMAGQLAAGDAVSDDVLAAVNEVLGARPVVREVTRAAPDHAGGNGAGGYVTRTRALGADATHLAAPVAESAAALLADGDPARVRRCGGPGCVLYFYDTSKNGSRRWCSMEGCGGRHKAAAYYRRSRAPRV